MEKQDTKRQVAHKVPIMQINQGEYVKQQGWEPNYILLPTNEKVSRVNIIAAVTSISSDAPFNSVIVDDGTGSIELRSFEEKNITEKLQIGQVVNVIGRPRLFGTEKFIVPEIIRQIQNPKWIQVRSFEIKRHTFTHKTDVEITNTTKEPVKVEEKIEDPSSDYDKIIKLIKEKDSGQGVDTQILIKELNQPKAEDIINKLLELGEIFETQPGKIKVLD